jgi:hypothetical protein
MTNEDERVLVGQMLHASRQTREAVENLHRTIQLRRSSIDGEIKGLRSEVHELRRLLVGSKGDNGLSSRVLLLENSKGVIRWESIGVIVALLVAAVGLFLK